MVVFFLFTQSHDVVGGIADYMLPDGYEKEMAYVLQPTSNKNFKYETNKREEKDSIFQANFRQLLLAIKECPEVESVAVVRDDSRPGAMSHNMNGFVGADTTSNHVSCSYYETYATKGTDFINTYQIKDAVTKELLKLPERTNEGEKAIVSAAFARQMFGRLDVVGERVHWGGRESKKVFNIIGVYEAFKRSDYSASDASVFFIKPNTKGRDYWYHTIIYRLKKGASPTAFKEKVMKEIAPRFDGSPIAIKKIEGIAKQLETFNSWYGVYTHLRYAAVMAGFVLLCVFLGMTGTFWIRCQARRQEIGLMCSIGASRQTIVRQFMTEAWLLVTIGFLLAQPLIFHYAHGMELEVIDLTAGYWQDDKLLLTLVTDGLIYLLMLLIALFGTWLPVQQAAKTLPAEALRDE